MPHLQHVDAARRAVAKKLRVMSNTHGSRVKERQAIHHRDWILLQERISLEKQALDQVHLVDIYQHLVAMVSLQASALAFHHHSLPIMRHLFLKSNTPHFHYV